MELPDEALVKARADVLSRILDGEAVLLDLESGTYFGLNEVGSDIWALIAEGATIAALQAKVLDLYDVQPDTARRDLENLVAELKDRGLVDVG